MSSLGITKIKIDGFKDQSDFDNVMSELIKIGEEDFYCNSDKEYLFNFKINTFIHHYIEEPNFNKYVIVEIHVSSYVYNNAVIKIMNMFPHLAASNLHVNHTGQFLVYEFFKNKKRGGFALEEEDYLIFDELMFYESTKEECNDITNI